jgi:uncharacterized protein (DUF2147 family)
MIRPSMAKRLRSPGLTVAIAATLAALAASTPAFASSRTSVSGEAEALAVKPPPESILGEWCTQKEEGRPPARVKFVKAPDGTYTGILTWSAEPRKDVYNKDPKLRDRSVVGIVLMWHLTYDDGEYVDGYVYNPEDGGTYRVKTEVLSADSMKVRGYLGISLFGQSKTWSRYNP